MKTNRFILTSQGGQGVLEYLIICALVGIFCLVAVKGFGKRIKTRINHMSDKVEQHLRID